MESTMNIEDIISAIRNDRIRITNHADEEAQEDSLTLDEIFRSVFQGEIIEDYGETKPYPTCLIHGNVEGQPIHCVWAYDATNGWAILVTVYRPDPNRWIGWEKRRPKQ